MLIRIIATLALLLSSAGAFANNADAEKALAYLRQLPPGAINPELIDGLEARLASDELNAGDNNLLCIGAFTVPFAAAFSFGLVPNPPWDYALGQVPAYAANLGLKFCPPHLEAPDPRSVHPNVATDDGPNCAYEFSQPQIAGGRSDFLGIPTSVMGDWSFTSTQDSIGLGTPEVWHFNTDVNVRLFMPGEAPPGYSNIAPEPEFVARIGPFGIEAPESDLFTAIGCALDGSIPFNNEGGPCPIVIDRKLQLPVGTHTVTWRAETEVELLDTLPPIYVPGKPPGSKKEAAKAILRGIYEAAREDVLGSFLETYPTGAVAVDTQEVKVFDTTVPVIEFVDPSFETYRVEANEPGGQSSRAFSEIIRASVVATDTCGREPQLTLPLQPFYPIGSHNLIWTARDAGPTPAGGVNEETQLQVLIVEDTQPPQIAPPPPVVTEEASAPATVDIGVPQVFDVADLEPVVEYDGPATFPFGTTVVRWRAIDASANVSPWVEQKVTVKAIGSNTTPVADNASASGLSFAEITVPLSGSDADLDDLFFYIDRRPDEGFFVAPLLPTFVDDLRVARQLSDLELDQICIDGDPLPVQDYVYEPQYVTTTDEGITYVIDKEVECNGAGTGTATDDDRIARFGPDGELLGEKIFNNTPGPSKLSFHPGGLPGYEQPFLYWVNTETERLITVDALLAGDTETIRIDFFPPGVIDPGDPIDATIDPQGIVYVADQIRVYAYDFLERDTGGNNAVVFLERLGAPASQAQGDFGQAVDMDSDSQGNVYVLDLNLDRIHKFTASEIDRSTSPSGFTSGEYVGWNGRCDIDTAPGEEAACNVAIKRSIGYSCTNDWCDWTQSSGDMPGQLDNPQGFAIDPNDILYVADTNNNRVQRFTPEGFFAGQALSDCEAVNCFIIGQFGYVRDVTVNASSFYVLDSNTDILHIFSANPVTMTGPDTGEVTYRSFNNFIGADTFDYYASDGLRVDGELLRSNIATATVNVSQNQRPPFATPGLAAVGPEDTPLLIPLDGSDADIGDTYPWEPLQSLTASVATQPENGSVSISGMNATYTPDEHFNGEDSFTFVVSDGVDVSEPEAVLITITPENDAPELTGPTDPIDLVTGVGYSWELSVGVFDPDSNDEHTLAVNWADGTVETEGEILEDGTITGPLLDFNASGDGLLNARHVYASAGAYNTQVCVTDTALAVSCINVPVTVSPMTNLNLFETLEEQAISEGQPVVYSIGMSNFEGEGGAGLVATSTTLEVTLDSRLSFLSASGASCSNTGAEVSCAIPDLHPIARGASSSPPPVDRLVTITALPDATLTPGTIPHSRAELSADQQNYGGDTLLEMERFVVATADYLVSNLAGDTPSANPGNGLCADANGRCSLRAAIEEANALGGMRVIALPQASVLLEDQAIAVTADVKIIGLGATSTEIIADGDQRVFEIDPGASLDISQLTLSGGGEDVQGVGGLINNLGSLLIEDAILQNGRSVGGGAISSEGQLTIRRSVLLDNKAVLGGGSGGAIRNFGNATLENVLLYNNEAFSGGAISTAPSSGATLDIRFTTIVANHSRSIGAGIFGEFSSSSAATLQATILTGNTATNPGGGGCLNQLTSGGDNIINDDLEGCTFTPSAGDQVDVDPLLEPLIYSTTGLPTMVPRAESPAMDAVSGACPATDLRGFTRPQDGGCEIGAYERGSASRPQAVASPERLDFGEVAPGGQSGSQLVFIDNIGDAPLVIQSATVIGQHATDFIIEAGGDLCSGETMAPSDTCAISLRFEPQSSGRRKAYLRVISNDPASPLLVELKGTSDVLFYNGLE